MVTFFCHNSLSYINHSFLNRPRQPVKLEPKSSHQKVLRFRLEKFVSLTKCVISISTGEQKASRALREASEIIGDSPAALQLRYLQVNKQSSAILHLEIYLKNIFLPSRRWIQFRRRRTRQSYSRCQLIWWLSSCERARGRRGRRRGRPHNWTPPPYCWNHLWNLLKTLMIGNRWRRRKSVKWRVCV